MGRPRKFDTKEVIAAARDQFRAKGYAATSCDDITAATGLGKGSMYAAFGDKHHFFMTVLGDYSAARLEAMRGALNASEPAIESLRALFRADAPALDARGPAAQRGCLLVNSTSELAPHDTEVVALSRKVFGALEVMIAETVERARDEGDLPPDTDPRVLAGLLLAVMQGQEFLAKTGMGAAELGRIGEGATVRLLGGAAAKGPGKAKARRRA
jgi:TetR/AcrR family transcriptional regulator, transcriptional repressor for nem operon